MSMSNLSIDGQFRYIVQWFNEWSELQRDDFVSILVEYLTKDSPAGVYMNGVVNSVVNAGINDKPMSLFQCRIKLFREWSPKWPVEFKHQLQEKINEIDTKVGEKVVNEIKGHNDIHSNGNGNENGTTEENEVETEEIITAEVIETDNGITVAEPIIEMPAEIVVANAVHTEPAEQVEIQTQEHVATNAQAVPNNAEVPLVA